MALKIHFLNVGHGDCTIIEHPTGRLTMIDINNSKSLPDKDVEALAEGKGMSTFEFSRRRMIEGVYRSWAEYYESLLVDPADYFAGAPSRPVCLPVSPDPSRHGSYEWPAPVLLPR